MARTLPRRRRRNQRRRRGASPSGGDHVRGVDGGARQGEREGRRLEKGPAARAYARVGTAFAIDDDDDDEELEDLSALHHDAVSSGAKAVRDSTEQVRWLQEERAEKQKLQQQVALANAVAAEVGGRAQPARTG